MTTDEEQLIQAECPVMRAAWSTGDAEVIERMLKMHPPASCAHVKKAAE